MKKKTKEFLETHQSDTPSKWREEAEWRRENWSWLRHSQKIAVKVLLQMKQRERIEEMEKHFERASDVVAKLSATLDDFVKVQESIKALESYYGSKEWKKDFRDDEKGLLPPDLKRGVLSEDGIWNLLEELRELRERIHI